ncbi:unnamed protein product [Dracunculus medinensis]|uniref:CBS domain-containing protein n=1 Tax=Dracunculus medinensis TaxID=318479 RepID=A0A0N4UP38_DRAME|nr:unnamed protein product [Dracunculus medinensis]
MPYFASPRHASSFHVHVNSESHLNYARLLQYNACYEAMPASSKLVIFDTELHLRKAFNGLIYQNTRHVLLSESEFDGSIVGILSVTDFIRVLLHISDSFDFEDIGKFTIKQYRAARLLSTHRIHRLPVMDPKTGCPLFILTHKRILKFMWLFGQSLSLPDYHFKSCKQLGIGTWCGIRVVFPDTALVECLDILLNKGVSGLPVVEHNTFKVIDMYSRFDAIGIALEDKINHLDVTVAEALAFRNTIRDERNRVVSINHKDCLWKALTVLVERNVHRLVAVDDSGIIQGLISLSDVMNYMVITPGENLEASSPYLRRCAKQNS